MAAPVIAALKSRKGKRLGKFLNDAEAAPEDYSAIRPPMAVSCFHSAILSSVKVPRQKVPSAARVAASAFGFLTLIQFHKPTSYNACRALRTAT
jgi:hypothetical protein